MNQPCAICGIVDWIVSYTGKIRRGKFGNSIEATVFRCQGCGVEFLPPFQANLDRYYQSDEYRLSVGESADVEEFYRLHDSANFRRFSLLEPIVLRDKVVADVGCGAGSFLDVLQGYARTLLAIEPMKSYHKLLGARGYRVYSYASDAKNEWGGKVDIVFSFSVIEHVLEPVAFLREIRDLLRPGGTLFASTPSRNDVLMHAGEEEYQAFFYRTQHAFYFEDKSLRAAATAAGFRDGRVRNYHNYGFANFINWLSKKRPTGNANSPFGEEFDRLWSALLEDKGLGDYLLLRCIA